MAEILANLEKLGGGGKLVVRNLGNQSKTNTSGYTWSATSVPNYQKLTVNNFFVEMYYISGSGSGSNTTSASKSYNASTGVLSYTRPAIPTGSATTNLACYCVTVE